MTIAAHWTIPLDHPAFSGHFPGTPILPGVVLLDTALHAIAADTGMALDLCEIGSVKFLSPVSAGEELIIQYAISPSNAIRFDIVTAARKIASGSVTPGKPA